MASIGKIVCGHSRSAQVRRRALGLAIATALAAGLSSGAQAQAFPPVVQLSSLDGTNGFKLDGEAANNYSGLAVGAAGDVNDDGIADLIVGAFGAGPNGSFSGQSYVVFGKTAGFTSPMQLSALNGSNGFKLDGEAEGNRSGRSVSAAGDVNGDGISDLIVGAIGASPNGGNSGRSYVVFGKSGGFTSPLQLSALNGSEGFKLDGEAAGDYSGFLVGAAGDVNGDGIDDLVVGAFMADPNGSSSGRSYVVFGKTGGFASPLQLSALNGSDGFKIDGEAAGDYSGRSISAAGDVNGDGIGDLIVGAFGAEPNGRLSGRSYVVFGRTSALTSPLQLSALNGNDGFKLDGEAEYDRSGLAASAAGDVNGDGIDDLIVGAFSADPNGLVSGRSYVVFGKAGGFTSPLPLSALNGSDGFKLDGEAAGNASGRAASAAGDVNGDGIADLIVGARNAEFNGISSGRCYLVFGKTGEFASPLQLSALNGNDGFKVDGEAAYDKSGTSVSAAGDVNGDGIDDLIVGAFGADPNGSYSGRSYVVFGRSEGIVFKNGFE